MFSKKPRDQKIELECLRNQEQCAPQRKTDKFPSAGDCKHATPTFGHTWAVPKHTVKEEEYQFLRLHTSKSKEI